MLSLDISRTPYVTGVVAFGQCALGTHNNQTVTLTMASTASQGLKNILQEGSRTCAQKLQRESLFPLLLCTEEKLILQLSRLGRPSIQGF